MIQLAEELGGICEMDGLVVHPPGEVERCANITTTIVYSRHRDAVLLCCDVHADIVLKEDYPEYCEPCPNCGCEIPIN